MYSTYQDYHSTPRQKKPVPIPSSERLEHETKVRPLLVVPMSSIEQFETLLASNYDLILVDVWASWCAPCKKGSVDFQQLAEAFEPYIVKKQLCFVKENIDHAEASYHLHEVSGVPTYFIYHFGKRVDMIVGNDFKKMHGILQAYFLENKKNLFVSPPPDSVPSSPSPLPRPSQHYPQIKQTIQYPPRHF